MNSKIIYDILKEYLLQETINANYYALKITDARKARVKPFRQAVEMFLEHMQKRRVLKYLIKSHENYNQ